MDAALEFHARKGIGAGKHQKRFVHAAQVCIAERQDFRGKSVPVCVLLVHTHQIAGKKSGFLAADTGPDFQNDIAGIHRIRGNKHDFQFFSEF